MDVFLGLLGLVGAVAILWWRQQLVTRRLSRERMFEGWPGLTEEALAGTPGATGGSHPPLAVGPGHPAATGDRDDLSRVGWWLYKAGYRSPEAVSYFWLATAGSGLLGVLATWFYFQSPLPAQLIRGLEEMPSGLGDVFKPVAFALPWILAVALVSLPTLRVRAARRKRVALVEQDLPITLELLATLAEAGIGFDAALERILNSQPEGRPLAEEFRLFQLEVMAGRPRVQCLRRLGRRIDVSSLTLFLSALVQASQIGSGVSEVLRRQVEELRNRRRENALTLAASLPVKLLFPLVICFLPGIFVSVLGPAFYQVFQLLESLNRNRGGMP